MSRTWIEVEEMRITFGLRKIVTPQTPVSHSLTSQVCLVAWGG